MTTSQTGTATINGATLAYETAGEGTPLVGAPAAATPIASRPPVVLIHAGIADSRMWDDLFAALRPAFTVTRYDLRGFGRTPPAPGLFAHHEDLAALLLHLGIGRAALVGCSIGSRIALDFALSYPEWVARLVMISPTVSGFRYDGPPPPQAAELDAADAAGDLARVNELEMQIWVDGPRRAPDQVSPAVRALAAQMNAVALANEGVGEEAPARPPATERLSELAVPLLVITGELDAAKTQATAEHLQAALPHARRAVVPAAAHLPGMEQPELVNRLVIDFLDEE